MGTALQIYEVFLGQECVGIMAERRMFTLKIVDSDAFLDMPMSAQALYFHLSMRADDDGFINNPKKIQRFVGASEDDLKLLILKRFVLAFETGVIVIKHWRMHNLIRRDRYTPTQYQEELSRLAIKDNGAYTDHFNQLATTWQPDGNQMATQDSIGKDSKGKDSKGKDAFVSYAGDDKDLLQLLRDFAEMRRKKGKPMTDRAKQMLCNKLETFPESVRKQSLETAIFNCWQSVYYDSPAPAEPDKPVIDAEETDRLLRLTQEMQK